MNSDEALLLPLCTAVEELQEKPSVASSWPCHHQLMKSRLSLPGCTWLPMHFQEHSPEPALLAEYTKDFIPDGIAEMFTLTAAANVT